MGLKELFTDTEIFLFVEPNMASRKTHAHPREKIANSVWEPPSALSFQEPRKSIVSKQRQDLSVIQTALASDPSSATAFFDLKQATQHRGRLLTRIMETTMKIKSNVHVEWLVKYLVTNKHLKLVVVVMVEVETKWSKKNSFILPGP